MNTSKSNLSVSVSTGIIQQCLKISDGREVFYQWDVGCKLIATGLNEGSEVHFAHEGMDEALAMKVYPKGNNLYCDVPDELLQESKKLYAYAYLILDDGSKTMIERNFIVKARPKPPDYIYTPTEIYTIDEAVEKALQEAKDSGEFKGDKGDDGKDGHDYILTEADKQEIADLIIDTLPTWQGGSY